MWQCVTRDDVIDQSFSLPTYSLTGIAVDRAWRVCYWRRDWLDQTRRGWHDTRYEDWVPAGGVSPRCLCAADLRYRSAVFLVTVLAAWQTAELDQVNAWRFTETRRGLDTRHRQNDCQLRLSWLWCHQTSVKCTLQFRLITSASLAHMYGSSVVCCSISNFSFIFVTYFTGFYTFMLQQKLNYVVISVF